jgi:hypothetical protein
MSAIKQNNNLLLQKYILDPLSTIIKLAVLGKKEIGCKILIKNNQIYIQENGMFQGIARYYHGVTKNDIHFLSIPIELACERYLTIEKINSIPDIIIIFKCAQNGLNNLMETYEIHPIIVHCLKYYHTIIDTHLQSIINQKEQQNNEKINNSDIIYKKISNCESSKPMRIPKPKHKEIKTDSPESYHTPNTEFLNVQLNLNEKPEEKEPEPTEEQPKPNELLLLYTNDILIKFDTIWDKSKINIVIGMIKYLLEEKVASEYAASVETFMIPIDKEILKIIN